MKFILTTFLLTTTILSLKASFLSANSKREGEAEIKFSVGHPNHLNYYKRPFTQNDFLIVNPDYKFKSNVFHKLEGKNLEAVENEVTILKHLDGQYKKSEIAFLKVEENKLILRKEIGEFHHEYTSFFTKLLDYKIGKETSVLLFLNYDVTANMTISKLID